MLHFLGMQINTTNKEKCIKVLTYFFKRLARRTIYNNIKAAIHSMHTVGKPDMGVLWIFRGFIKKPKGSKGR